MAQVYYNLIVKGYKSIDEVPVRWKAAVQTLIDAVTVTTA